MTLSPRVAAQPLVVVADVQAASAWYRQVLGMTSGHGGDEYERLIVDGELILQLHHSGVDHHHGPLSDPSQPRGNGVILWFALDEFEDAVARSRAMGAEVEMDVHVNPNAKQRELWLRDLDGYRVVLAERTSYDR